MCAFCKEEMGKDDQDDDDDSKVKKVTLHCIPSKKGKVVWMVVLDVRLVLKKWCYFGMCPKHRPHSGS